MVTMFLDVAPGMIGAIKPLDRGGFKVSVLDLPSGRTFYGFETTMAAAVSWVEHAPLALRETEGEA